MDWRKNIQPNHRYRSQLVLNQNEINRFENNQFQAFQKNQSKPISNSCSVMDLSQQSVPNFVSFRNKLLQIRQFKREQFM